MDITAFVSANREKAFSLGDYSAYRSQLSRQTLSLRRKLKRTTPKNQKNTPKPPITAEDVGKDSAFTHLQLLIAERAWAHAMSMKSARDEDTSNGGITGLARKHIISRLRKASICAQHLVTILEDRSVSKASDTDYVEAKAYLACMQGSEQFERAFNKRYEDTKSQQQAWHSCLVHYSEAHIAYTALAQSTNKDVFKEMITGAVDPSIRYAAYQSRFPRTVPVSTIAKQHFPADAESTLLNIITKVQPDALDEAKSRKLSTVEGGTTDVPTSIEWRGRTAPIADASVGQAMAATTLAVQQLSGQMTGQTKHKVSVLATAYDPVLTAAQDTVDAIRHAITELTKEGVPESDARMQDLRVSDLAANYTLISWRVGRNRVLASDSMNLDDGLAFTPQVFTAKAPRRKRKDASKMDVDSEVNKAQSEGRSHQLKRLRARGALFDSTLQSFASITQLPGAARDKGLVAELNTKRSYFDALRSLNVGRSYCVVGKQREALALFAHAAKEASNASASGKVDESAPPSIDISSAQVEGLRAHVNQLLTRQRGLVALQTLSASASNTASDKAIVDRPLAQKLAEYPASGTVDLTNLVAYPPEPEPVPVKPIFLDLAWNFITYPGQKPTVAAAAVTEPPSNTKMDVDEPAKAKADEKKGRGWFGFGR